MALLWLRVALIFYGVGLLYTLVALTRRRETGSRVLLPAMLLGAVFHFVSLTENTLQAGHLTPTTTEQAESLMAFLVATFFLAMWMKYRAPSPAMFVLPLVFLLSLAAAFGQQPSEFASPLLRQGWVFVHVTLIFLGYAALFLSFVASILYLLQERSLKSKRGEPLVRLPALEVMDELGYRSLLLGFPFMTLGLIAGSVLAQATFGAGFFRDPKILLSLFAWAVYLLLLYTRWHAGWRGRRAAVLSTAAFLAALGAWAANYVSGVHRFLTS